MPSHSLFVLSQDNLYPQLNGGQSVQGIKPMLELPIRIVEGKKNGEPAANMI